jgi:hypothetical protein
MAVIQDTIVTTFMARGGNALAVMGQIRGGIMNVGREARNTNRELSQVDKTTRAFGTTLRYAFAGSVLFGATALIGKLDQLQQKMGLIAAIAGPAGVNLTGGALSQLEDEIASKAVDARTTVSDLNDSVINFLSSVQGAKKGDIAEIVGDIGMTARLSQTPVEDLTKAVSTMNIGAGRANNLKNLNALLREWFNLVSTAPGGIAAGPQIAQQLGPLSSVARAGRLTPEQIFGFSLGSLRFGATPSTGLRGTQYFLQSLFQPTGASAKALSAAGFTPERLDKEGGAKFTMDFLKYVRELGAKPTRKGIGKFAAMVDANPDVDAELAPNENIEGMSPAALKFLRTSLGRIHGIRTAMVLISQLERAGNVSSLSETLETMLDLRKGIGKDAKQLKIAADKYRNATPLQSAAIALDTLRTVVGRDLAPILGPISKGITSGAEGLRQHDNVRKGLMIGAGGLLAMMGISKWLPGGGGFRGLLGIGGRGFVAAKAAESVASGSLQPGSFNNPLYVIVIGQVFGGGNRSGPGGPVLLPEDAVKKGLPWWKLAGLGTALGASAIAADQFSKRTGIGTPISEAGYSLSNLGRNISDLFGHRGPLSMKFPKFNRLKNPMLARAVGGLTEMDAFGNETLKKFSSGKLTANQAEAMLNRTNLQRNFEMLDQLQKNSLGQGKGTFTADGEVSVVIKVNQGGRVTEKRIKVDASIHRGGKHPTSRGKRGGKKVDIPLIPGWVDVPGR